MSVPAYCRDAVGQREILKSLKTSDELEAAVASKKLQKEWRERFKEIRRSDDKPVPAQQNGRSDVITEFRSQLSAFVAANLSEYLDSLSAEELVECSRFCRDAIYEASRSGNDGFELDYLLGVDYPPPQQATPGLNRKMRRVYVGVLHEIRSAIDEEAGEKVSEQVDSELLDPLPEENKVQQYATKANDSNETGILAVANLMIDSKNVSKAKKKLILTEVAGLREWCGGKNDLTTYTKLEVVDYVRNCLLYIPKNRQRNSAYEGKSLKQCVEMTKANPAKHAPISYQTCKNRFAGLAMVFNYAKEDLAIMSINLARGIEVPELQRGDGKPKALTTEEIKSMWTALKKVAQADKKYPERYWVPVLGLFHGFRLNEICSLRLKDIYVHADGTFVIDVNENGATKSVKNKSSLRIVPVHPHVRDALEFKTFVEQRGARGKDDDLLFPNLTYAEGQGYGRKMTRWFNDWKIEWLLEGSRHKNFHSLRHTFIQQAQNKAKMSDRCAQEITGHSVTSVSAVHRGYSGRLLPKAVLEELAKVEYKLTE
jgi:integrase